MLKDKNELFNVKCGIIFLKYILDGSAISGTQQNEASTRKRSFGGYTSRPSAAHPK
jgi:hypothetical protein